MELTHQPGLHHDTSSSKRKTQNMTIYKSCQSTGQFHPTEVEKKGPSFFEASQRQETEYMETLQMLAPSACCNLLATGTALVWAAKENLKGDEEKREKNGPEREPWDKLFHICSVDVIR